MSDKIIENNQVTIMGEIASDFTFSHEVFGEGFYMVEVKGMFFCDGQTQVTYDTCTGVL